MSKIFQENFPLISSEEWLKKIYSEIPEEFLPLQIGDILVKPFYRKEDWGNLKYLEEYHKIFEQKFGWQLLAQINGNNFDEYRIKAGEALKYGAQQLLFDFENFIPDVNQLYQLFQNLEEKNISPHFKIFFASDFFLNDLKEVFENKKVFSEFIFGSIDCSLSKEIFKSENALKPYLKFFKTTFNDDVFKNFKSITIGDNLRTGNITTIFKEVGYLLSLGVEMINQLRELNIPLSAIVNGIQFSVSIGENLFVQIAKLRALRFLWYKIVEAFGMEEKEAIASIRIQTFISSKDALPTDSYTNLIKYTIDAMAGILGGADALCFASLKKEGNESFVEHISRNISHILKEESFLDKAKDPLGGSFYIESLTDAIAQESWGYFVAIEKEGGFKLAVQKNIL